jgi:hypothetical protein
VIYSSALSQSEERKCKRLLAPGRDFCNVLKDFRKDSAWKVL